MNVDDGVEAKPYTYGARLTIARESLVNDDVGLLTRAMNELGALAARKEAALVAAVLEANANLGDSDTLFNSDNSVTGDLDVSGLDAAFAALRQQPTGGGHYANLSPGVLLVPPDEVMTAELLMQSMRNPPRLISNAWLSSGTRYVFASPQIAPTLVRLRLAGDRPGPVISKALSRGDTGDGVEIMFFHDVGIVAGSRVGVVKLASA